jgi:hypothetical protein
VGAEEARMGAKAIFLRRMGWGEGAAVSWKERGNLGRKLISWEAFRQFFVGRGKGP